MRTASHKKEVTIEGKVDLLLDIVAKTGLLEDYLETQNAKVGREIKKSFREYRTGKAKPLAILLAKYQTR